MTELHRPKSSSVRPPAVAGRFYPGDALKLRRMIEGFLSEVKCADAPAPKAVIAPHAGYIYSGPVAASAYARFVSARDLTRRIVLFGPSHYWPLNGLATTSAKAWATPLGIVPVDTDAVASLDSLPQVKVLDEPHEREHSLEVHLPFLQVVLNEFKIVPLVVGDTDGARIEEVIELLWGGEETRFVVSSDLSHYHDYFSARELDSGTAQAIERLRPQDLSEDMACGCAPICGLLRAAQEHHLRAHTVDLRNSGDTAGPRNEVVGYGAFVFDEQKRESGGPGL